MTTISTSLNVHLNALSRPTSNYEIRSATSLRTPKLWTISFIGRRARDPGETGKELLSKGVNRISRGSLDLAVARSKIEAEEILYRYNNWNIYPSTETALPGAIPLGVGSLRWSESFVFLRVSTCFEECSTDL